MKNSTHKFINDPLYSKIIDAVDSIIKSKQFIAPIDLFISLSLLTNTDVENWRFKRIPYLEKAIKCNLSKAIRILEILSYHALELKMKPSTTVYMNHGKAAKSVLRFSKTGDKNIEKSYSTHFVNATSKSPS